MAHRFIYLDGIRGIAAISVVLFHFLTQHTEVPILRSASYAVDVFFCLSGFVIAHGYKSQIAHGMHFRDFGLRRLIRLYPMFLIGLYIGLAALLIKTRIGITDYSNADIVVAALHNLIGLPYLNAHTIHLMKDLLSTEIFPLNGPAWSLFFEAFANIAFFYIATKSLKYLAGIVMVSFIGLALWVILFEPFPGWGSPNIVGGFPRVMFGFFSGVVVYRMFFENKSNTVSKLGLLIERNTATIGPLLIVSLIAMFCFPGNANCVYLALLAGLPVIIYVGANLRPGAGMAAVFRRLAYISYPLYCLHAPVLNLFDAIFTALNIRVGVLHMVVIAGTTTLSAAICFARVFDEPIRRRLTRLIFENRGRLQPAGDVHPPLSPQ